MIRRSILAAAHLAGMRLPETRPGPGEAGEGAASRLRPDEPSWTCLRATTIQGSALRRSQA